MNVAVTGATGHLGGHLVRALLEAGHRVRVLQREDLRNLDGLDLERVRGELADATALDRAVGGVEVAFHLAGRISIRSRDDAELTRTNVDGVRAIAGACRRNRVRRLVHFSSIHAFRAGPPSEVIDERGPDSDVPGADPYDRSKARGQKVILEAVQAGLDAVIVNPTGVIGPLDFKPSRMGGVLDDLRRGRMPGLIQGGFNWVDARDGGPLGAASGAKGQASTRLARPPCSR
jgi:dihydroflavonol-4-reductase